MLKITKPTASVFSKKKSYLIKTTFICLDNRSKYQRINAFIIN